MVLAAIIGTLAGLSMVSISVFVFASLIRNSISVRKMKKERGKCENSTSNTSYSCYYKSTHTSAPSATNSVSYYTSYTPAYDMSGRHVGWYDNSKGVTMNITKTGVIVPSVEPKK